MKSMTNIASECRSANIVRDHAVILPDDATPKPDGIFGKDRLARQITEAFPWASAPTYLVRDNDRAYGHVFKSRVRAMGIRDRPISPRSPWQNPYVERLIGTVRRECLDRVLIFGEAHLLGRGLISA